MIVAPQFLLGAEEKARNNGNDTMPDNPFPDTFSTSGTIHALTPLHPLTHILLSECNRTQQYGLSHYLQQSALSCTVPGVAEQLTLICWHSLINGYDVNDMFSLLGKAANSIDDSIHHWRKRHPTLSAQIEDYVFFACFSNWSAYR
ncbi:hypothetical protein VSX61_21415 [Brenneria populi subsp. brevivirga]|uniref:hypothetical protein n=1 Tax=Brenneria populi TaxID=1505588 RepID=UPI002E1950CA|nr:hypothetical protein [Brenneria populi subsp. brevivirga]